MKKLYWLAIIIAIGILFRLYGVNWDWGQHLHPDERFLTMVATSAKVPVSFFEYLNPQASTINPYNLNFPFFVYGTLPVTVTKIVAAALSHDNYFAITIIGRIISALLDTITLVLVYKIARRLAQMGLVDSGVALPATLVYGLTVFVIQQSHFFTVDPWANLLVTTSFYLMLASKGSWRLIYIALAGVFFGLSVGSKMSAIFVLPLILAAAFFPINKLSIKKISNLILPIAAFMLVGYLSLRLADPRMFENTNFFNPHLSSQFIKNINELMILSKPESVYPPSVQWLSTWPILTPAKDLIFFGLGPIVAALVAIGITFEFKKIFKLKKLYLDKPEMLIILFWMIGFFVYQGVQFGKTMRYFYFLYPALALFAGIGLGQLKAWNKKIFIIALASLFIWPMAFIQIYSRPHTRVSASEYIYANLPEGSTIVTEHWDDSLPLPLPSAPQKNFRVLELPVFDPDVDEKWQKMDKALSEADYYILSSNRGYGSIMNVPERYPKMSQFYRDLFDGKTNFQKLAEFTSYPSLFRFSVNDSWADEAFSVYDHPRVLIYKKVK